VKQNPVFETNVDRDGNILRIRFLGRVGAPDMGGILEEFSTAVAALRPGFLLLTDLSALELMDVACAPQIGKMMELGRTRGIGTVIRIVPDYTKDIGFNIMSCFHYDHGVSIVTCETAAEAERAMGV
jgi:hypothetical protein